MMIDFSILGELSFKMADGINRYNVSIKKVLILVNKLHTAVDSSSYLFGM